jgi:hypothetical protein
MTYARLNRQKNRCTAGPLHTTAALFCSFEPPTTSSEQLPASANHGAASLGATEAALEASLVAAGGGLQDTHTHTHMGRHRSGCAK